MLLFVSPAPGTVLGIRVLTYLMDLFAGGKPAWERYDGQPIPQLPGWNVECGEHLVPLGREWEGSGQDGAESTQEGSQERAPPCPPP